jgi:glycosyltransferase involved in cell wall biosynthesis
MNTANETDSVRVLFINDTARDGGPGRSLHAMLRHMDRRSVRRTVLLPRPGPIADLLRDVADDVVFDPEWVENIVAPLSREMAREDHQASLAVRASRAVGNAFKTMRLIGHVARLARGHDLVYGNGTLANFLAAGAAWRARVPALWHVRYTSVPKVARFLHRGLAGSRTVRRIVCVSRPSAALFPHCGPKVEVVPNGLDVAAFAPGAVAPTLRRELGLPPDAVVFGSVGRILRRKGYLEMVRAARITLDALNARDRERCHFVVIGDTPPDFAEDHRGACVALARELQIDDRVTFLGFRTDVRPYLADFDVVVVPSVYQDPLPRAVIEGMALGKPVVAFDVGGVSEMVTDGVEGTLVPLTAGEPADVGGLAAAMLRAFRDPAMRRAQGAAARARVERDFDARAHAAHIEKLIRRAAARPAEAAP